MLKAWSLIDRYTGGDRVAHELTKANYLETFLTIERAINGLEGDDLTELEAMLEGMWLQGTGSVEAPRTAG